MERLSNYKKNTNNSININYNSFNIVYYVFR